MKKFALVTVSVLLIAIALIAITDNTHVYNVLRFTVLKGRLQPAIDEYKSLPNRVVRAGDFQPWLESQAFKSQVLSLPENHLKTLEKFDPVAFLVIKEDQVLYEKYWEEFSQTTPSNSFSMAKSIVAAMVGVALKEGRISSLDDPISKYLPDYLGEQTSRISIRHLLTMSSGIAFDESYINPFAYPAKANYGDDLWKLHKHYNLETEPGKEFDYQSGSTQILGFVLAHATGQSLSVYASKKLWQPIGASTDALWTLDKEDGLEKAFCCFNSNARDFARLGRLYMQFGNWNGNQIIDSSYIIESVMPAPLLESDGRPNTRYGYSWWLTEYENQPVFYMRGLKGQYVLCIPEQNVIIVRLGRHRSSKRVGNELPADVLEILDAGMDLVEQTS